MYAIAGATGHTGKIVAKRLLEEGKQIRAIGRDRKRLGPLIDAGAEPFVGDLTDAAALSKAFAGAKAAYVMIPPDMASKNVRAFQDRITDCFASALAAAGVEFAVTLSSIGADKPNKTGPVVGVHNLEKRLGAIDGLNVLHLRAGYFMENTLAQANVIHAMDKTAGPIRPDLKLPMIATRDIAHAAAEALLHLGFTGQQTRELLGPRDLTMTEAARIIGQAIGKPDLSYVQLSDNEFRNATAQMGMSTNVADLILEMVAALNSGHMRALESRSGSNATPTSFETFVAEEFVPVYEGRMAQV
ncbi:MAG: NAD(P)H-binding protein [Tepidisphaeraceae bacterium]|jgi:uncharacterized protein YbjT (DUF2867 family)